MYTKQPKKMLIINILDILKRHSDQDHRLSQKDILRYLREEYEMDADRKSIRRNIEDLMDFGYDIEYKETIRSTPNPKTGELEENNIWSDFYLVREFDDSELRLLIDSLLFSKHIPYSQCKELIEKLEALSSEHFRAKVKHISTMPDQMSPNKQLFLTIDVLDEAISKGRQVEFSYLEYGTDKRQHARKDAKGEKRVSVVNPYQMAAANGRYYLICNYDQYDNVANVRIDRITDIRILDTPAKDQKKVKGLEHGLNLPKHMAEHVYMFSGESAPVTFRFRRYLLNDVIDWFGREIAFVNETEDEITARITVNLQAMQRWAVQYAPHAAVMSPERLVEEIRGDLEEGRKNYS